jgi:glycosyltransferase involved in cell wall biosynthesis
MRKAKNSDVGIIISILIPSIHSRAKLLDALLDYLLSQIVELNAKLTVEIVSVVDNKEISTGAKRNQLLKLARGKYIVFIDDDDWVPGYFVGELLKAAESNADCFATNGTHTLNGGEITKWWLSKANDNVTTQRGNETIFLRKTNHLSPVKRELALLAGFPNKSNAEDKWYSDKLNEHLITEYVIEKPMYEYREKSGQKEYI